MKKAQLALVLILATALAGVSLRAASPHVVGSPKVSFSGSALTIEVNIAGLGNLTEAPFDLSGSVDLFSRCYNGGGNKPAADNKQETIDVSASQTFPVSNGRTNVVFIVLLASTLDCPGSQRVQLESFLYALTLSGPQGFSLNFNSN